MPVLCDALPQGLDNIDTELVQMLRTAYEEWLDSQQGLKANSEMHRPVGHMGAARSFWTSIRRL